MVAKTRISRVSIAIQNCNVVEALKALKDEFNDLIEFTATEVNTVNLAQLVSRITSFVVGNVEKPSDVTDVITTHIAIAEEKYTLPSAALNYLRLHSFVGYINYGLVKACQIVTRSVLLEKRISEYEKDYRLVLECSLKNIHTAFKKCPDLKADYVVGLPNFVIHLASEWEGRKMYEWKELLRKRFGSSNWPESLAIEDITENCILIRCAVWPIFAKDVIDDLTNDTILAKLKQDGVTIQDISPKLLAYKQSTPMKKVRVC